MALWKKLFWLGTLYVVQGLPVGFQGPALTAYLRRSGLSLTEIGFVGMLALPWLFKALWAPAVDRFGSHRFGRRRSWILPLQGLLALTCAAAAFAPPSEALGLLLGLLFLSNLMAATLDIAVDGLAVDLLDKGNLGLGNIAQVVGFKVGMLLGGGVLPTLTDQWGWQALFGTMTGLILLAWVVSWVMREPQQSADLERTDPGEIVSRLKSVLIDRRAWLLLAVVAFYKLGEKLADEVFPSLLIDNGYEPADIAAIVGSWGMVFSMSGSVVGGLLASRMRLVDALMLTATFRVFPLAAQWALAHLGAFSTSAVVVVTCCEAFFGGALTTAMFALMMSRVDRSIGASHYTLLASIEVFGKAPAGPIAGMLGDALGYRAVFALATLLSAAYLVLPWRLRKRQLSTT